MEQTQRSSLNLSSSPEAIEYLVSRVSADPKFQALLEQSLVKANAEALKHLDPGLYGVLSWPTNFDDYVTYLEKFAVWAPRQGENPGWQDPETGQPQEVYDHLCHFYYLIDQGVGLDGTIIIQDIDWFGLWLVTYADLWGSFLSTPESFNKDILNSFMLSPEYQVENSMTDGQPTPPNQWISFNDFFSRFLNPGLRPIASPTDNSVITSPADCTYRMQYAIDENSNIPEVIVKKTHAFASIPELLENSQFANAFANGTFVHYFLGPYSYHRFHTPIAGELIECYPVQGLTYLEVNIDPQTNQFSAPDNSGADPDGGANSGEGYEFTQARGVLTIDTCNSPCGDIGIVAVVPVGMCQVSSVKMTATTGPVDKGTEFGHFLFGGSDIILLFQEGKAPVIDTCDNYRHYGTDISICPPKVPK